MNSRVKHIMKVSIFFVTSKLDFFLWSDTLRDKQQRARKKKGEEEVRKTRASGCSLADRLCRVTIVFTVHFRAQRHSLKMHLSTMIS